MNVYTPDDGRGRIALNTRPTTVTERFLFDKWHMERPMTLGYVVLEQLRDCCFQQVLRSPEERPTASFGLHYFMTGEGLLSLGGREFRLAERCCLLTLPKARWTARSSGKVPVRCISVAFQLSQAPNNPFTAFSHWHEAHGGFILQDKGVLENLLLELMDELGSSDPFAEIAAEGALSRIMSAVCRVLFAESGNESATLAGPSSGKKDLAYECVRYMDRHLTEIRELGQIADSIGYSYSHLSHVFRLEMGVSLQSYWNRKRILHAMKLLQSGEASITRIAETLHYQSVHSFSKAFKKISGLSPTDYQELYGRERSS
jgi:AraC-like DNA-binding protein/mannose-6-phosphate isomerase-like protein (cupin superfamily)